MRRFADHWKIPEPLAARVPAGAPGESADCDPPVLASFRGTPAWIHPLAPAANAGAFATDDGSASFLPDDAIANVQLERYVAAAAGGGGAQREALLKRVYYLLKPVLPRPLQIHAQRVNARARLRSIDYPLWPHDDSLRTLLGGFLARVLEEAGLERVPFIG